MLTVNSLSKLLSKGKSETFECREGKALTPRYITELYSAFANTYGGVLVLGIKEDPEKNSKERFTIVGVEDPAKIIDDFWNTINSAKVSVNLLVDSNVYPLTIDDKTVVVIEVPRITLLKAHIEEIALVIIIAQKTKLKRCKEIKLKSQLTELSFIQTCR